MDKALDERILSQLDTRFLTLEEEYTEELDAQNITKGKMKAIEELEEKLEELENILNDRKESVFLISNSNTVISANQNAIDYKLLNISPQKPEGICKTAISEYLYTFKNLPDGNFIVILADVQEKNDSLTLLRNRFLVVSLLVTLLGILITNWLIKSSLKGFFEVRQTADLISQGDYNQRVLSSTHASKEVKELANSFNKMIDRTQALLKEIKEVSNNVAHDLRTPLTRIRGKVETTLLANADIEEHKELSGIVIEECDKLMHLINNMLTLAEYESGLIQRKSEKISLKELLHNLCDIFETVCEDKEIKLELEIDNSDLQILGDKEKIQRSLANLLDNAIKYSDPKKSISITAKSTSTKIEITIKDNGCGINIDDQTKIFDRFYRVDESRTTPGHGLGLNLAKAFIENHDGTIDVESTVGVGSSFVISLNKAT